MPEADNLDGARRRVLRAQYVGRINRVIDYIEANLAGDLSLDTLASVAAFSPFHFHRIFKTMVGENLSTFIRRTPRRSSSWTSTSRSSRCRRRVRRSWVPWRSVGDGALGPQERPRLCRYPYGWTVIVQPAIM
jgi:hypothetical protein